MAITNEDAMQDLIRLKELASQPGADYWSGVLTGKSGAYMITDVITLEQYTDLHDKKEAS